MEIGTNLDVYNVSTFQQQKSRKIETESEEHKPTKSKLATFQRETGAERQQVYEIIENIIEMDLKKQNPQPIKFSSLPLCAN
jgi:hypothetical protein